MPHVFRVGYRRGGNGRSVPVCEPAIGPILEFLQAHAWLAILDRDDRFLAAGTVSVDSVSVTTEGSLLPPNLMKKIEWLASDEGGGGCMRKVLVSLEEYPFRSVAESVVRDAGPLLLQCLDRPFVEVEPFAGTGRIEVSPVVRRAGPDVRVVVQGAPPSNMLMAWENAVIRDRVRDAILDRLLRDPIVANT